MYEDLSLVYSDLGPCLRLYRRIADVVEKEYWKAGGDLALLLIAGGISLLYIRHVNIKRTCEHSSLDHVFDDYQESVTEYKCTSCGKKIYVEM